MPDTLDAWTRLMREITGPRAPTAHAEPIARPSRRRPRRAKSRPARPVADPQWQIVSGGESASGHRLLVVELGGQTDDQIAGALDVLLGRG